jgi:hypothetical protein
MSKLIEALKTGGREFTSRQTSEAERKKTDYQMTQEQLADIYFSASDTKQRKQLDAPPVIIKVVEKQGMASLIPWIITSIAFLITAFSLFSTKRVFVDINVIDEKSPIFSQWRESEETPAQKEIEEEAPLAGKISMKPAFFEGASKLKSTADKNALVLVNSSVSPFARATLRLNPAADLEGMKVVFYAKGARGGEALAFALKDEDNVLAFRKGKVTPFPTGLTRDWQRVEIHASDAVGEFDKRKVIGLRFEFGTNLDNKPGDTVFVKDLQFVPA